MKQHFVLDLQQKKSYNIRQRVIRLMEYNILLESCKEWEIKVSAQWKIFCFF